MSHQPKLYSIILLLLKLKNMFTTDADNVQQHLLEFYVHLMFCYFPYTIFLVTTFDCPKLQVTNAALSFKI